MSENKNLTIKAVAIIRDNFVNILLFFIFFIIYFVSVKGPTPYNYFIRLAESFLHGRYWITENPLWLSELIPTGTGEFFIVYPPLPAIILMPIVKIFGPSFPQDYLANFLASLSVVYLYLAIKSYLNSTSKALWLAIAFGLGTNLWFLSAIGSVWYTGQVAALFFQVLAFHEALTNKRPTLLGIFIGASYLCRVHTILLSPIYILLILDKNYKLKYIFKKLIIIGVFALPFYLFNAYYNYIRFSSIFDKAYVLIPGLFEEVCCRHGLFHYLYIKDHLRTIFMLMPKRVSHFPYFVPSFMGTAVWVISPFLVYAFLNFKKNITNIIAWVSILIFMIPLILHSGNGFSQFGYRFLLESYPIFFFLIADYFKDKSLGKLFVFLIIISLIVNLWGVVSYNYNWLTI